MNIKIEINKPARMYGYINTQLHHNYKNRQKKIKEVWMLIVHTIKYIHVVINLKYLKQKSNWI